MTITEKGCHVRSAGRRPELEIDELDVSMDASENWVSG
jgi:hypothetical protein